MNRLITYTDYRKYLNDLAALRKEQGQTNASLARLLGCQAAYLSQVLREKVDLTEDHLLCLCEHLEFSDLETEYLLILLRIAKAGNPSLKRYLNRQLEKLRESLGELEPRISTNRKEPSLDLEIYYSSSWVPSVIHLATSCEDFQFVKAIAERFSLPEEEVLRHLHKLEKFSLVKREGSRWIFEGGSIHFSKNSLLDLQLQTSRRLLALNTLSFRENLDLHYSVVFSTDKKTAKQLREIFLDSIEKFHKLAEPTPSEDVYSVCIDFFRP